MPTYYFLVGIPGSGKSHFARRLAEEIVAVVVCPDEIRASYRVGSERAFEIAREQIKKNLKAGKDVVFDATNTIKKWRRENILAGNPFSSRVACCIFDTPLELCLERQRRRAARGEVDLPENIIRRMDEQLANNPPALEEGFDEIRVYAGIVMAMTSGPFAGRVRRLLPGQVSPKELLAAAVDHGWHWKIDYSYATLDEIFLWLRSDMVCRAVLAKQEGRSVYFEGRKYTDLQKWKDAVTSSGQMVEIDRDDETGYWIKGVDPDPE